MRMPREESPSPCTADYRYRPGLRGSPAAQTGRRPPRYSFARNAIAPRHRHDDRFDSAWGRVWRSQGRQRDRTQRPRPALSLHRAEPRLSRRRSAPVRSAGLALREPTLLNTDAISAFEPAAVGPAPVSERRNDHSRADTAPVGTLTAGVGAGDAVGADRVRVRAGTGSRRQRTATAVMASSAERCVTDRPVPWRRLAIRPVFCPGPARTQESARWRPTVS